MTQVVLAKKMNVDQSTVSLWETGGAKPLSKHRKKLAKLLNCALGDLEQAIGEEAAR
jgi:ribosome-binding protein aMBF1 (putative translation factor)